MERGEDLVLKPNSIVFVTVEPMFRIPDYMALRFNLKIRHVYKGLLVGTGPLVDPGFIGKLSLPLHNLTATEHKLKGGDPIIWMEFTKLSPNDRWQNNPKPTKRLGVYKSFPIEKNELINIDDYLYKAVGVGVKVRSSIPDAIEKAAKSAEEARRDVGIVKGISVVASLVIILSLVFGIILPTYELVNDTANSLVATVRELETQVDELQKQIVELEKGLNRSSTDSKPSKPSKKGNP